MVRVIDDIEAVKQLQAGHGEWTDEMAPVSTFLFQEPCSDFKTSGLGVFHLMVFCLRVPPYFEQHFVVAETGVEWSILERR